MRTAQVSLRPWPVVQCHCNPLEALVPPQQTSGNREAERVGERDRQDSSTTEPLPAQGYEPGHVRDDDQLPEIVGNVLKIEPRAVRVTPLQRPPKLLRRPSEITPSETAQPKSFLLTLIPSPRFLFIHHV